MARYINYDDLLKKWHDLGFDEISKIHKVNAFNHFIKTLPTVDVAEVKHGEWSHLGGDEWCCTNCGEVITTEGSWEKPTKKYCNECGAKMDGGKAE